MPDDPSWLAGVLDADMAAGETRSEWLLVAGDGGAARARVGFRRWETVPDPSTLGSLPPFEAGLFAVRFPTGSEALTAADVLRSAVTATLDDMPSDLQFRINAESCSDPSLYVAAAEAAGFRLFQEKQGYLWEDTGQTLAPAERVRIRTIDDVGVAFFADVMSRCQSGTLDRNDRFYAAGVAPGAWGTVMAAFLDLEDHPSWLLAEDEAGTVGYVALGAFNEPDTATIVHVGILPERRGAGFIDELLAVANLSARDREMRFVLSDVDVENAPMRAAMLRAGHREDARPWHVWDYRAPTAVIARSQRS